MATTLTTNNPQGLGYQTGYFSGPLGEPLAQHFFDAAFAGRINTNKIYKEAYHCDIVQQCTMSTWLDEYAGAETDCYPAYTLLETYGRKHIIKIEASFTLAAYPATTAVRLADTSYYVGGQFILPQIGNTVVLTPIGVLAKVTAVNLASSGDAQITLQQRDTTGNTGTQSVTAGDELLVLAGSTIEDCACPTGQFRFDDLPIELDLSMDIFGDKGEICGDALLKCQWLKIPFTDECGNVIEKWYTDAMQNMYRDHEMRKHYERLLNPKWGLIPTLRARAMKWTPASANEITTDDVRSWKALLDAAGISCREYAIFAGGTLFSQFQRMLLAAGVTKLDNTVQPNMDCKWINMQYCGIMVEGLTLHIYEECTFSNGKLLGSGSSKFPASAIVMPMCNRPSCSRSNNRQESGSSDNKMLSTVYFKDLTGRVWDNLQDSNGILNGPGGRNTFGTGCNEHEWTVQSRFLQEVHCANTWSYMGLT
jgi:hypothetical protein